MRQTRLVSAALRWSARVGVGLALVVASSGASEVAHASTGAPFTATLTGDVESGAGNCCGVSWEDVGSGHLTGGVARFQAAVLYGCFDALGCASDSIQLFLSLRTSNGSVLTLVGSDDINAPVLHWHVDQLNSTGRFARWTGSGTYTYSARGAESPGAGVVFRLIGSVSR